MYYYERVLSDCRTRPEKLEGKKGRPPFSPSTFSGLLRFWASPQRRSPACLAISPWTCRVSFVQNLTFRKIIKSITNHYSVVNISLRAQYWPLRNPCSHSFPINKSTNNILFHIRVNSVGKQLDYQFTCKHTHGVITGKYRYVILFERLSKFSQSVNPSNMFCLHC